MRCEGLSVGHQCVRCARLGLVCEPAPQHTSMPLTQRFRPNSTAMTVQPSGTLSLSPMRATTAGQIWLACESEPRCVQEFVLRHLVAVAKCRNAYSLLEQIVHICKGNAIDLNVVLSPMPDDGTREDDVGTSTSHPFDTLQAVSVAQGYSLARTVSPNGSSAFFSNAAFENDVISIDACVRTYERNEAEVASLFIHPDDLQAFRSLRGRAFLQAARNNGQLTTLDSSGHVRVRLQPGRYAECALRMHVLIRLKTGLVSAVTELIPSEGCTHNVKWPRVQSIPAAYSTVEVHVEVPPLYAAELYAAEESPDAALSALPCSGVVVPSLFEQLLSTSADATIDQIFDECLREPD